MRTLQQFELNWDYVTLADREDSPPSYQDYNLRKLKEEKQQKTNKQPVKEGVL